MSQYGDPGPGHRNALDAVAEARQRALRAVSQMRQVGPPPHDPRLAPAGDDPALATIATQAVTDYLIQLRPYRGHSATWDVSFGELQLPEDIQESNGAAMGWDRTPRRRLHVCRQPALYVENVSDFVEVANMTVQYSSKTRRRPDSTSEGAAGSLTLGDPNVRSAPGDTSGQDHKVKSFKLVFNAGELQQFLTLGDDVAAELDVLADLEAPDHAAGPGGAV
jgi:hypothetical protein